MRGRVDPQESMFSYFSPDSRVPEAHPLRRIKQHADTVLGSMNPEFDRIYAEIGRPSIPPERLLKASLLIALYSVRSDRLFCEMLDYNMLFRWFLDMSLEERGLDQSNFSRLRERLVGQDTARVASSMRWWARRVRRSLLSDEHFTVDGTLIEAWASQELQAQGRPALGRWPGRSRHGRLPRPAAQQRHPRVHHRRGGEARAQGQGQRGQALLRRPCAHGEPQRPVRGPAVRSAIQTETEAAKAMLARQRRKRVRPSTLGGDKGYHRRTS